MKIAEIKFTSWGKIQHCEFPENIQLNKGDLIIIDTEDQEELGQYIGCREIEEKNVLKNISSASSRAEEESEEIKENHIASNDNTDNNKIVIQSSISRRATKKDIEKIPTSQEKKETLDNCQRFIDKHNLDMKLVDAHFSLDGSKITFAFAAEERIDFRMLVRDLTGYFNCAIRLHQIGKRDEAKVIGDCGPCGRILCCKSFIKDFSSITSKMAETQQVVHRGSERISGVCSRLKCCLQYEQQGYKELAKDLPDVGEEIELEGEKGIVVSCNVLKQTVDAKFKNHNNGDNNGETIVEVNMNSEGGAA